MGFGKLNLMENEQQKIALWRLLGLAQGVRDAQELGIVINHFDVFRRMIELVKQYEQENTENEQISKRLP